ncbi:MAG: hypothetical protein ACRC0L_05405, partial [Angustibacter sp.]
MSQPTASPQSDPHVPRGPSAAEGSDFAEDYPRLLRWWHAWRGQHPRLWTWVLRARATTAWLGLLLLVGVYLRSESARAIAPVYLGCGWLLVLWFITARTKTVSWALLSGFTGLCVLFAPLIGRVTTILADGAVERSSSLYFGGIPLMAAG